MTERTFHMAVLGRTLEHLGVQMYKRRDTAIAELVANCWDANATNVWVTIPDEDYDQTTSTFIVEDDGDGMSDDDVEDQYLVVGRNRRRAEAEAAKAAEGPTEPDEAGEAKAPQADGEPTADGAAAARRVMGRKGIGKLAGFGIATKIELTTWCNGKATRLTLDMDDLKLDERDMKQVPIVGEIVDVPDDVRSAEHGTRIVMRDLKHKTVPEVDTLREALARRFSRTVRGHMKVMVNEDDLTEPTIDWEYEVHAVDGGELVHKLDDDREIRYRYGFAKGPLASKELRGFTILTHGKTAQAPPYFFDVETTATGQHGTRYLSGTIEADFLDNGTDDESDLVSTDRQEIDWEDTETLDLLTWGQELTRKALRDFRDYRAKKTKERVLKDPDLKARVGRLDKPSQQQAEKLLGNLGLLEADNEKELELASSLVSAFEYRHFHDVIDQIEAAEDNPEQLELLLTGIANWKALEGRAILEIIKGRISIIDRFHEMIVNDAPETKSKKNPENMHDLLADFPWLLHPEWQVLSEERTISKQLREWNEAELADSLPIDEQRQRYDFLALGDQQRLVVIEIKRAHYAPDLDDVQRLIKYQDNLSKATEKTLQAVFVSSKQFLGSATIIEGLPVLQLSWGEIHDRTKSYYEHYRAVLEADATDANFHLKAAEVAKAREVLEGGAVRPPGSGLGSQDDIRGSLDAAAAARGAATAGDVSSTPAKAAAKKTAPVKKAAPAKKAVAPRGRTNRSNKKRKRK